MLNEENSRRFLKKLHVTTGIFYCAAASAFTFEDSPLKPDGASRLSENQKTSPQGYSSLILGFAVSAKHLSPFHLI